MNTSRIVSLTCIVLSASITVSCGRHHHDDDAAPTAPPKPTPPPALTYDQPTADQEVRMRGYQEWSSLVSANLLEDQPGFTIAQYLGGDSYGYDLGLAPLVGYFDNNPVAPGWRNASPNTMSSAVMVIAFDGLGRDLAQVCEATPNTELKLRDDAQVVIKSICDHGANASDDELKAFWQLMTGGIVPAEEFAPWLADVKATTAALDNGARFSYLVTTALAVPSFIFKQ